MTRNRKKREENKTRRGRRKTLRRREVKLEEYEKKHRKKRKENKRKKSEKKNTKKKRSKAGEEKKKRSDEEIRKWEQNVLGAGPEVADGGRSPQPPLGADGGGEGARDACVGHGGGGRGEGEGRLGGEGGDDASLRLVARWTEGIGRGGERTGEERERKGDGGSSFAKVIGSLGCLLGGTV